MPVAEVNAICTQCEKPIMIDDTQEAGICQYCGKPFATEKAIKQYLTNITNDFVGAVTNIELEQLLSAAEVVLNIQKFHQARNIYKTITQKFPQDYRGWWGLCKANDYFDSESYEIAIKLCNTSQRHQIVAEYNGIINQRNQSRKNAELFEQRRKEIYCKQWKHTNVDTRVELIASVLFPPNTMKVLYKNDKNRGTQFGFGDIWVQAWKVTEMFGDKVKLNGWITGDYDVDFEVKLAHYIKTEEDVEKVIRLLKSKHAPCDEHCYIATCVYGSYDCPQVWTLRRFRDYTLDTTWYGRAFIKCYYATSPTLVKWFGNKKWFRTFWKKYLDTMVSKLHEKGVENTQYND